MTKTPANLNGVPDHPDQRSTPTKGFPCLMIRPSEFTAHRGYYKSVGCATTAREACFCPVDGSHDHVVSTEVADRALENHDTNWDNGARITWSDTDTDTDADY